MVTTVILSMLCLHLLCFSVMFLLISKRLNRQNTGVEVFALGNLLLGVAYILQLLGGPVDWGVMSVLDHTLTLCAPVAFALGAMRFFGLNTAIWSPLLTLALIYLVLQISVQWLLGSEARHALLAASCALLFCVMASVAFYGRGAFAKDLRPEMLVFGILISGICVLNVAKFFIIVFWGGQGLSMNSNFQQLFYLYMLFLGTVLPPSAVWLVLCRLTDELRLMATLDPLTRLLNRRGLVQGLEMHFSARAAKPAHLLIVDVDHFKRVNDTYGHKIGDQVLCHIAQVLNLSARQGDLICRLGGEEFVVVGLNTDRTGALQLAERIRAAVEQHVDHSIGAEQPIRCTVTIGVSNYFSRAEAFEDALQQADAALYRGKRAGRNCVEWVHTNGESLAALPNAQSSDRVVIKSP